MPLSSANDSPSNSRSDEPVLSTASKLGSTAVVEVQPAMTGPVPPVPPFQVGPYRVEREIGRGAMGAVFEATHLNLKRKVALKLLPDVIAPSASRLLRFHREMEAIGRVDHPNLVRAMDAGEFEGIHYLAMELVAGVDLDRTLAATGRLSVPAACEVVRQTALGLQHLCEHHLVHRDIKPSNLLVTPDGVAKILDLGVAMLREPDQTTCATMDGALMGTPDFMAPEQIEQARDVDIRADVYSLGCTLYTLIAGQPPFCGPGYDTHVSKLVGHSQDEPRPLSELAPEVPPEVERIIERMMAKRREDRYERPQDVADAVASWASREALQHEILGIDSSTRRIERSGYLGSTARRAVAARKLAAQRRRVKFMLVAAVLGILLLLFAIPSPFGAGSARVTETLPVASYRGSGYGPDQQTASAMIDIGNRMADSLQDVANNTREMQRDSRDLADATHELRHESQRIASAVDELREAFVAANHHANLLPQPANVGQLYHNATVQERQGNLLEARRLYDEMFTRGAEFVDVHQRFQEILVAQEGIASARKHYRAMPGDSVDPVRRLAHARLLDQPLRVHELERLAKDHPDFGPACFELCRSFSPEELGPQTLTDKVREKEWATAFVAAHEQGNVLRYYLDQTIAFNALKVAQERLAALATVDPGLLDQPVSLATAKSRAGWHLTFRINEPALAIWYRTSVDDDFQSTGFFDFVDPATGKTPPRPTVTLPGDTTQLTVEVKYVDLRGNVQGPYALSFDDDTERLKDAKRRLESTQVSWVRFGDGRAVNRLYIAHLLDFRDALSELRYSLDGNSSMQTVQLAGTGSSVIESGYLTIPAETQSVAIQLQFVDGSTTRTVEFER